MTPKSHSLSCLRFLNSRVTFQNSTLLQLSLLRLYLDCILDSPTEEPQQRIQVPLMFSSSYSCKHEPRTCPLIPSLPPPPPLPPLPPHIHSRSGPNSEWLFSVGSFASLSMAMPVFYLRRRDFKSEKRSQEALMSETDKQIRLSERPFQ